MAEIKRYIGVLSINEYGEGVIDILSEDSEEKYKIKEVDMISKPIPSRV